MKSQRVSKLELLHGRSVRYYIVRIHNTFGLSLSIFLPLVVLIVTQFGVERPNKKKSEQSDSRQTAHTHTHQKFTPNIDRCHTYTECGLKMCVRCKCVYVCVDTSKVDFAIVGDQFGSVRCAEKNRTKPPTRKEK